MHLAVYGDTYLVHVHTNKSLQATKLFYDLAFLVCSSRYSAWAH